MLPSSPLRAARAIQSLVKPTRQSVTSTSFLLLGRESPRYRLDNTARTFSHAAIVGGPTRPYATLKMTVPEKMRAVGIRQTGDFDVIEELELPVPTTVPGNVLIKVHYAGVNFIDTYFRKGLYPIKSLPTALGGEAAGEIVALPSDETVLGDKDYKLRGFKVGDKVAAYGFGSFAEYVSVAWDKVFPLPEGVSTRDAAAALTQGATALTFVTEAYAVQKGDTVLVHTVAGGLGLFFAQLIKARGATVIGTTSTPDKAAVAKAHGADHVILYKDEDTVQRVLELTNGEGVHAIFDGVGKDTFEADFKMIRRKGTLVSVGNASGAVPPFPPLKLVEKNVRLLRPTLGNYVFTPEEGRKYGEELFKLVAGGTLKVTIHAEYPFTADGVQQAQKDLTGGKSIGKLLIKIAEA
ncbi:NAD-P-binding protein [Daedaleopsis nitida]|nr:NAD-P-binding protein [Daedaleopsis nitida]